MEISANLYSVSTNKNKINNELSEDIAEKEI